MKLSDLFKSALSSLWSRRVRSFLTSLGVIIGVFAVAALLSVAEASVNSLNDSLSILNSEAIELWVNNPDIDFDYTDVEAMEEIDSIEVVSPYANMDAEVINGYISLQSRVVMTVESYKVAKNIEVHTGRFLLDIDQQEKTKSVVLGINVAINLFGGMDIIGEVIDINGDEFTVVGVLKDTPSSLFGNTNDYVFIPKSTGEGIFGFEGISQMSIKGVSDDSEISMKDIEEFLMIKYGDEDSYNIFSNDQAQSYIDEAGQILMLLLGGIGAISLLVSGIGIMNIMLVSVRERTREIGIRKAIGARRSDILIQFLVEAVVLSLIGGIIGILLTYVVTSIAGNMIDGIDPRLSLNTILISTIFSFAVGVVFGLYPALKASKLTPVEALRYE